MKLPLKPTRTWCRHLNKEAKQEKKLFWRKPVGFETGISLWNPIEKKKVPFILNNYKIATWYMCGPTVYDSAHIGHACSYMRLDIIRRILTEFFSITVIPVMGITDIDDKIIARHQSSTKFATFTELTKYYEQEFHGDMKKLNILPAYLYCRVSDYIPEIIQFISALESKGFAYRAADNSIYFDTTQYKNYGKLWTPEESSIDHRFKRSKLDFALWKAAKSGEPSWESPWGPGRPGWHIECSAMGSITLGKKLDIHSGGIDLIFPHHENEEAQCCSHHEVDQWVNYWLHTGLLHLEDTKMSKSLQNTITIKELLEKYTANQFRFLCLITHYRSPIDFSQESMQKAMMLLKKFEYFQSDCMNYVAGKLPAADVDASFIYGKLRSAEKTISEALANDFGTPRVINELSELVAVINKALNPSEGGRADSARNVECVAAVAAYVSGILNSLGISRNLEAESGGKFNEVVDNFVKFRSIVRNKALVKETKDKELLEACDNARKSLAICGVKIKDYKDNATWTLTDK